MSGVLGRFDISALCISLETPTDTDDVDATMLAMCTLLHERTHWLQSISTTVGAFSHIVTGLQDNFARHAVESVGRKLSSQTLPLNHSPLANETARSAWQSLEYLHHLFFVEGTERISKSFADFHTNPFLSSTHNV